MQQWQVKGNEILNAGITVNMLGLQYIYNSEVVKLNSERKQSTDFFFFFFLTVRSSLGYPVL